MKIVRLILSTASALLLAVSYSGVAVAEIAVSLTESDVEWGACPAFFPAGCEIAVLHGDPSQPNTDIFFRVPGNYSFPAHNHTSAERMVLISGEMNVNYVGQETTQLVPGSYAYGPPLAVHDGSCVSAEPCLLFIAFEDPVDAMEFIDGND